MKRIDADIDADLKRELSSAPLRRKGFTDELRMRIEERVDRKEACSRSWFALAGSIGSVTLVAAAVVVFALFGGDSAESKLEEQIANATPAQAPALFSQYADQASFRSGLLVGLRTDDKETSYRTLYIAPKEERPAVVAQGSGILVPYKRDFYRIEPLRYETVTDRYEFFVAHPASQRAVEARKIGPVLFKDDPNEKVIHAEKLLFAANEYVSIGETNESTLAKLSNASATPDVISRAWTTTIPNLTGKRQAVALADVLETKPTSGEFATTEWIVGRSQGRWVAMLGVPTKLAPSASASTGVASATSLGYEFRKADVPLPKTVINHDEPCCTWSEIGTRFPEASDTFSSPDKDMTVVATDGMLLVYGNPSQLSGEPALSVKLKPKETIIMAQWATDHYVEEWAQKTVQLLR